MGDHDQILHQATQAYSVIGQRLHFLIFFIRYVLSWSLGCLCFHFLSATTAAKPPLQLTMFASPLEPQLCGTKKVQVREIPDIPLHEFDTIKRLWY